MSLPAAAGVRFAKSIHYKEKKKKVVGNFAQASKRELAGYRVEEATRGSCVSFESPCGGKLAV